MNIDPTITKALNEIEIEEPTEIQAQAIPAILNSPDTHILAQAKTGTGKTLAFAIPLVEKLDPQLKQVQAVILVPTRELCKQIYDVIRDITKYRRLWAVEVYGGVSIERQIENIQKGAQIVIATPGRLIDIYERGEIRFREIKFVVLDEADRMLDMGFFPDMEFILLKAMAGLKPRLMLFSATLFDIIKDLAKKFTEEKNILQINVSHDSLTVDNCDQSYYLITDSHDKYYHFVRILIQEKPQQSIIFVNTKRSTEWLYNRLSNERNLHLRIDMLQGDMTQRMRETVMRKFRDGEINCLIATDVAARGLDFPDITHIFNYDLPELAEDYVHRIGRTSRMQRKGKAISLCMNDQLNLICRIEGFTHKTMEQCRLPPRNAQFKHSSKRSHSSPNKNTKEPKEKSEPKPDRRNFLY